MRAKADAVRALATTVGQRSMARWHRWGRRWWPTGGKGGGAAAAPPVVTVEPPAPDQRVTVHIVLQRDGAPVAAEARVSLRRADGVAVAATGQRGRYRIELVPDRYLVEARPDDRRLHGLARWVEVAGPGLTVPVELVDARAPRLRRAGGELVVDPHPELVAVTFEPPLSLEELNRFRRASAGLDGFEPVPALTGPEAEQRFRRTGVESGPEGELDADDDPGLRAALDRLSEAAERAGVTAERVRTGFVVRQVADPAGDDADERRRLEGALLTDRYVVTLPVAVTPSASATSADQADAAAPAPGLGEVLRRLDAVSVRPLAIAGTHLVRLRHRSWRRAEAVIGELIGEGVLRGGEAELLAPVLDAAVTLTDYTAAGAARSAFLDRMQLETAWNVTLGDPSVRVATFDRGISSASSYVTTATVVGVPSLPAVEADPGVSHGMEVYSLVSGAGLDGCWGVAPNATHVVGKLGSYFDTAYWDGLRSLVVNGGARVISLSHEGDWGAALTYGWDTLHELADLDVVLVAAAGNRGKRIRPSTPTARPDCDGSAPIERRFVDNPLAAHPRVIAVGLTEQQGGTDIAWVADAPDVGATNRGEAVDCCVDADGVTTATLTGPTASSGTSMAAPIVAATAALMRSVRPALTAVQIRSLLCRSADPPAPGGPCGATPGPIELGDHVRGGVTIRPWDPAVPVHEHHLELGWGRLNIGRAVRYASSYPAPPNPW